MEQVQPKSRIPELDGIRGLAILSVICFHYISMEGLTFPGSITDRLHRLVILGGTGVDLFFVLSGFLIGGILLDAKESSRYFSTFYLRRFFRIIPAVEVVPISEWRILEEPLLKVGHTFRY